MKRFPWLGSLDRTAPPAAPLLALVLIAGLIGLPPRATAQTMHLQAAQMDNVATTITFNLDVRRPLGGGGDEGGDDAFPEPGQVVEKKVSPWIGTFMFGGTDPATGETRTASLELVRLAIPRRVYTTMQMNYVARSILDLHERRDALQGMRIVKEPPFLRHFSAKLEFLANEQQTPSKHKTERSTL